MSQEHNSDERRDPAAERAEDLDTAKLVDRFKRYGDERAFGTIYTRYLERLFNYLRLVLNDEDDAEDAAQQTFLRALEAMPSYEPRPNRPFRSWLFAIARNQAIDELRRRGKLVPEDPQELGERIERDQAAAAGAGAEEPEPGSLTALNWISDPELLMFVERLPLSQRQVVVLRYLLDLSGAQIAAALDRTPHEVRMLQSRATRFIRDRLVALGRDPKTGDLNRTRVRPRQAVVVRERKFILEP